MDQVHVIRHKVLVEGVGIRQAARQLGVARNTVRRYVGESPPTRPPTRPRGCPVTDVVRPRLIGLLEESPRWTGGKQRLTATRLHAMLIEEGYKISPRMVRQEVAEWKRQHREVFVPLLYQPGELGEVDFFEVLVDVAGQRQKAWMFLTRLMYSGRDFAWLYPRQDQVCFLDGHTRAFAHFGAVPHRLAYDNLKPAVTRILVGGERDLAPRFEALSSHCLFEASFARPATGHDKGGVEARGKGIRWQHLVPIPAGEDLNAISQRLMERLDAQAGQRRRDDGRTVAERFAEELAVMLPLPRHAFRSARVEWPMVSRRALVQVDGARYSVWSTWAGMQVTAHVGVDEIELVGPENQRVHHPLQPKGGKAIDYRHYLPQLARKPQAVRQVAHELLQGLGKPFGELWRDLVDENGPRHAARVFAKVLDAVVEQGLDAVVARLEAARAEGIPVLLALHPMASPRALEPSRLPASLRDIEVISGHARDYDALLMGGSV